MDDDGGNITPVGENDQAEAEKKGETRIADEEERSIQMDDEEGFSQNDSDSTSGGPTPAEDEQKDEGVSLAVVNEAKSSISGQPATKEGEEIVVLVVGNEAESQSRMADVLAKLVGSPDPEITPSGVQIFASKSSSLVVVQPLPMAGSQFQTKGNFLSLSSKLDKRLWISKNSLRRILGGKLVFVVCVISNSRRANLSGKSSITDNGKETIAATFGIFKRQRKAVLVLIHKDDFSVETRSSIKQLVAKNLQGFTWDNVNFVKTSREGEALAKAIVERDVRHVEVSGAVLMPMRLTLQETPSSEQKIGTWDPERVILFGRSGSRKSTLAELLTKGKLKSLSERFLSGTSVSDTGTETASNGGAGRYVGRGWYVIDTPGFDSPNEHDGKVLTDEAQARIGSYLQSIEGTYSHYLFVAQNDGTDSLQALLWKFFVELFARNSAKISSHFSVVILNAGHEFSQTELDDFKGSFPGCTSFLCVNLPPINENDNKFEAVSTSVGTESLKQLEDALAQLGRTDTACTFKEFVSSSSSETPSSASSLDERALRKVGKYANIARAKLSGRPSSLVALTNLLVQDDKVQLLPV